ncbi:S-layer homology domain-containing protein [Patescibacteria group bacterium]|nr:S-layer homology domain-containing protein [Patescibacteria group bacterium]
MRRLLFLITMVLFPVLSLAQVAPFLDVLGHPHASQIEFLHSRGIVDGYGHGIFRPDFTINRAEFLKILMLAVYGDEIFDTSKRDCFIDFTGEEQWFWKHACAAKERGVIEGYPDGTFKGTRTVNLAEALKMSIDAWSMRTPVYPSGPPNWYDPYFDVAASKRIFTEFPYNPGHLLTRSEMAVLLMHLGQRIQTVTIDASDDDWDIDGYDICGDGILDFNEMCDDGNTTSGDGCSDCFEEENWDCTSGICIQNTAPEEGCTFYMRDGEQDIVCATCGNGVCESFELCIPSTCNAQSCSNDCGDLYCPRDCEEYVLPFCGNGRIEALEECDDGNNEDSDGCSSICVIVPEPVRHSAIRIEQRPIDSGSQSAGSNNVLLLAFDAIAGRQSAFITGVQFAATSGDLTDIQFYRLIVDMNGDGIPETIAGSSASQRDSLAFSNIFIPVTEGIGTRVELVGDITGETQAGELSIGFDTSNSQYIHAVGAQDGRELIGIDTDSAGCNLSLCWIAVFTTSTDPITVTDRGNLYVKQSSTPVRGRQLRAGTLSEVLMRFAFRAEGEDIEIEDIAIAGGSEYIDELEFYEGNTTTSFAKARSVSCKVQTVGQFCASTSLVIPQNSQKEILVKAFVRPDSPLDVSGDTFALYLTTGTSPQPAISAFGKGSDESLSQNDNDGTAEGEVFIGRNNAGSNNTIASPTHEITASNIVSIENDHDDLDGTSIPIGNATFAAFKFTVSDKASSNSFPVHIRDLVFKVNASNVTIDPATVTIYNKLNPNSTKGCSASDSTGNITVTCSNLETSSLGTTVNQGASVTLSLRANILSAQTGAGAATLQASIRNLGNRSNGGTVEWDDGITTFDWVDIDEDRVESTRYRSE